MSKVSYKHAVKGGVALGAYLGCIPGLLFAVSEYESDPSDDNFRPYVLFFAFAGIGAAVGAGCFVTTAALINCCNFFMKNKKDNASDVENILSTSSDVKPICNNSANSYGATLFNNNNSEKDNTNLVEPDEPPSYENSLLESPPPSYGEAVSMNHP